MLSLPRYSQYERPGEYSSEHPVVLVRKNVIRDVGMPTVNYDGLYSLAHEKMGIPTRRQPKIKLYGGSVLKRAMRDYVYGETIPVDQLYPVLGFHCPYTWTVHVNASAAVCRSQAENRTMRTLIHELSHLKDSKVMPTKLAKEWAIGSAALYSATALAAKVDLGLGLAVNILGRPVRYAVGPWEQRANKAENSRLYFDHKDDIVFPPFRRRT